MRKTDFLDRIRYMIFQVKTPKMIEQLRRLSKREALDSCR